MVVSLASSGCTPLPIRKTHFGYTRQIVNLDSAKTRRPEIMPAIGSSGPPSGHSGALCPHSVYARSVPWWPLGDSATPQRGCLTPLERSLASQSASLVGERAASGRLQVRVSAPCLHLSPPVAGRPQRKRSTSAGPCHNDKDQGVDSESRRRWVARWPPSALG